MAHNCTVLCSSWINPSWPEKYLAVSLFQINILVACVGTTEFPHSSVAGKQTGAVSTVEPIVTHCFSLWPWNLKAHLSPGSRLTPSLHLKLSRFYSESILKLHLSGQCFTLYASTHLALQSDLRSDCFSWNRLAFDPFLREQGTFHWNCACFCPAFSLFLCKGLVSGNV